MSEMKGRTLLCVLFLAILVHIKSDLVSSISGLETIFETEAVIIEHLEKYIQSDGIEDTLLSRKLSTLKHEHAKANVNLEEYLSNPISAFSLIRRLSSEWKSWEAYMAENSSKDVIKANEALRKNQPFPKHPMDLKDAVNGIVRLQQTYELNVSDMAAGILDGVQYDHQLHSEECFEIAAFQFMIGNHYDANLWFEEALKRFADKEENSVIEMSMNRIHAGLAMNKQRQGDLEGALKYANIFHELEPEIKSFANMRKELEQQLSEMRAKGESPEISGPLEKPPNYILYEQGCRGEYQKSSREIRDLYCHYEKERIPFLRIAPIKTEVVNLDPYAVIFHDIVTDAEIHVLKSLAKPKLSRAEIFNDKTQTANHRTSKYAWFAEDAHPMLKAINRRIDDMTGLTMTSAEKIQVMNYGLGGHYSTHYDYFDKPKNKNSFKQLEFEMGNRIATVLFYISDVEKGGATVFPELKMAVQPKKGSAVFWYNLNSRGEVDPRTLHAACPVLVGSKWVFNKWIREGDQLFRRPCEVP